MPRVSHWIFREPAFGLGYPVFVFGAALVPLYLGWAGTFVVGFAAYLVIAAAVFCVADAWTHPAYYPRWRDLLAQAFFTFLALLLPAAGAFLLGGALAPAEEAWDDQVCAADGLAEDDSAAAEADDALDLTADCTPD